MEHMQKYYKKNLPISMQIHRFHIKTDGIFSTVHDRPECHISLVRNPGIETHEKLE